MDDSLAERIQYLLDRKCVTPYIASKKSGVSEATFSRLLSQKNAKPNSYTLNRLSEYFNVSEQWILTGENESKKNMEADPPGVEEQVPTLNTFTNMSTDDDLRGGIKDRNEIINKLWLRIENLETANKSLLDMLHGGLGELKTLLNKRE